MTGWTGKQDFSPFATTPPRVAKCARAMRTPVDIEFAVRALVGTASPVLDVITSFQEQIE